MHTVSQMQQAVAAVYPACFTLHCIQIYMHFYLIFVTITVICYHCYYYYYIGVDTLPILGAQCPLTYPTIQRLFS